MPGSRNDSPSAPAGRLDLDALESIPIFAGLDRAALADVVGAGRIRRLPKDGILFEQGAPATTLHLLLHGRLKVMQDGPGAEQTLLRFVGPNEPAGVLALLGPGQRPTRRHAPTGVPEPGRPR